MDEALRTALREHMRQLGLANRRHGGSIPGSDLFPTYRSWQAMKRRCDNPKDTYYQRYGGRGIRYDPRWARFDAFLADMGPRPDGTTLDRLDNDGPYTPSNTRWATFKDQRANRPQPSGWKQRPLARPKVYGTKTIACLRCGAEGTVKNMVGRWICPACRRPYQREATARWRAKQRHR
jgi:hypothetical protein